MRNTVFKLFLIVGTLAFLLTGCDLPSPWDVSVSPDLEVKITAGPSNVTVPNGAWITFKWTTAGGTGNITSYQYMLDGVDAGWSSATLVQNARYDNVTAAGSHTFHVKATDSGGNSAESTVTFTIGENSEKPVVAITQGLEDGWKIATGQPITFVWSGNDASEYFGTVVAYSYKLDEEGAWSDWADIGSVTLTDVPDGDHTFYVKGQDNAGDEGDAVMRAFIVKAPSILWIDDWYRGSALAELWEKQFMDMLLAGYAWAEYDFEANADALPDLTGYTTMIWTNEDGDSGNPWFLFDGAADRDYSWFSDWADAGGNFMFSGGELINGFWWDNVVAEDDFVAKYLGLEVGVDYEFGDGTYYTTWCTFVHGDEALGYPAEMKVDVAKDEDQHRSGYAAPFLQADTTPIFTGGVDVDGDPSGITDETVGYLWAPAEKLFKCAYLGFPNWYMPGPGMRTTYLNILDFFGE